MSEDIFCAGKVKILRPWMVRKKRPDYKVAYLTLVSMCYTILLFVHNSW